ncbi:MAG: bifunctional aspartate kinase/homoserine dehydrogenase I [Myxococcota bacterium]
MSSAPSPWFVHKFGGSSVADASCFWRVRDIVVEAQLRQPRTAIVLSACRGVTDALLALVKAAATRAPDVNERIAALHGRHAEIATLVLAPEAALAWIQALEQDLAELSGILSTVSKVRSAAPELSDLVAGYGELWSSDLFARLLGAEPSRPAVRWLDARKVLRVDWGPLGPQVDWATSAELLAAESTPAEGFLVIPGFVASDRRGIQTTLGRNGSDYSASIFGKLLRAQEIIIWTDVDGVLSADPRKVPDAQVIDALSYSEAMELAYFGAKVLHPQTMSPAIEGSIPIWIRNTFAPHKAGSVIERTPRSSHPVKGITSIDDLALLNLEGAGMIGVPGTAHRLFGALREAGISVILISQGSSEHSICCAIPEAQAAEARRRVVEAFDRELSKGQIQRVELSPGVSILAVVGDGMAGTHGVAAKVFSALGAAGVNVRAIAQGASERNISVVVDAKDTARALRAVHSGFYLSPHTISLGLIGPGIVGGALLEQIASQRGRLMRDFRLDLRVRAIATSTRMLLAEQAIDLSTYRQALEAQGVPLDLEAFARHVDADHVPHAAILDCTASLEPAGRYLRWLEAGIHVITPNKKANSGPLEQYLALQETKRRGGAHYLYEATVGAGLPIIQTLRDLRETGDEIRSIEGILSGTLAYLFNVFDGSRPFSEILLDAKQKGYTEPDPRDDLSGMDVARKLIILGREMGLRLALEDVRVEGLVPEALVALDLPSFLRRASELDAPMKERLGAAKERGAVLRYVGRLDPARGASVGLMELPESHAFANIALTDNVVRFQTARYSNNPLIVQGPGAGPAVTAGGVFGDLLRLAAYLGAKL